MIYRCKAFPRAALVGNPSDGYHGKTIAFVFKNYCAEAELYESPELDLLPWLRDHNTYNSIDALYEDVRHYGYYGGIRLIKAAIKRFREYTLEAGIELEKKNFTIRYKSDIPNRLGLAGSSAIITAAMRALCAFYDVKIRPEYFANLILAVERDELGIPAGLQDRVAQSYNIPMYMDFNRNHMEKHSVGLYRQIDIPLEMNLYVAFRVDLSEGSEVLHSRLRHDYEDGIPKVLDAMKEWAALTDIVKDAIEKRDYSSIGTHLNRNFDLRCEVCRNAISEENHRMVSLARSCGASAKFTGSGGAIIGTYEDEAMYTRLKKKLAENGIKVIRPDIVRDPKEAYK